MAAGAVYKYDLSLPVGDMYGLVDAVRGRVAAFEDVQVRGASVASRKHRDFRAWGFDRPQG